MKNTQSMHFDNIATASQPVYRRRMRKPFTCYDVRMELIAQAAELPEYSRDAYINERLTDLDRALNCDEAEALERWLDCEDMLQGRATSIGEGGGAGSGLLSQHLPDSAMDKLADHADHKRMLDVYDRKVLAMLAQMMEAPHWLLEPGFIRRVCGVAQKLTKLHMCMHS